MESEEILTVAEDDGPSKEELAFVKDTAPSLTASIHPLVIMNLNDQVTRSCAAGKKTDAVPNIVGALMGKHTGREVEIMNSFELFMDGDECDGPGSTKLICVDFLQAKLEQFKQVFSDMECLGWYSVGSYPTPTYEDALDQLVMVGFIINANPVLLKFLPCCGDKYKNQPITIYEAIDVGCFVVIPYTIKTGEAERIVMDHMADVVNNETNEDSSLVAAGLMTQVKAIKMLQPRVKLLLQYVRAVQNKEVPGDHQILREILSLTHRLRAMSKSSKLDTELLTQHNDVALIRLLSTITISCCKLGELRAKLTVMEEGRSTPSFKVSIPLSKLHSEFRQVLLKKKKGEYSEL